MMKTLRCSRRTSGLAVAAAAWLLVLAGSPTHADAQWQCDTMSATDCSASDCACPGCQAFLESTSQPSAATAETVAPTQTAPGAPETSVADAFQADMNLNQLPLGGNLPTGNFASTLGATPGGRGIPSMIGDFFGSGFSYVQFPGADSDSNFPATGDNATIAVAGGDRQFKTAENNSPFPQDRVFFNYHHFHNAVVDATGGSQNLDRYTFGLEKTFWDGLASFEIRTPFSRTVTSSPSIFDAQNLNATEFGNISLAVKGLLYQEPGFATSLGLGVVLPTGDDFVVDSFVPNRFENGAVRLQPFMGVYYAPTSRTFTQFFTQLDFDAGESEVMIGSQVDNLQMQTLLMLDYSVGYWLMRNRQAHYLRGMAPMIELHYTTTVEDQDYGVFTGQDVFVEDYRRDVLNVTAGLFIQLGDWSSLKIGGVAPLRDGSDKLFDSEFGVQFVRNF